MIVEFFKSLSFNLRILLICIISALIITLLHFGLYDVIVNFIIAGAIPGTHMSIPYWLMLLFYGAIALNILLLLKTQHNVLYHQKTIDLTKKFKS